MLTDKFRPYKLNDIVGQDEAVCIIRNILKNFYIHRAFMISGVHGVGKTSLARIFVKCINCEVGITDNPCNLCYCCISINSFNNPDSIEIDAASNTKVDDIKEILSSSFYKTFKNRFKTYIIDECHMLSLNSFNFFLKVLEDEKDNSVYIFVTTHINKIPSTILSRCINIELKKVDKYILKKHLYKILCEENYIFNENILNKLLYFSDGSVRNMINIIEKFGNVKNLSDDLLDYVLGLAPIESIFFIINSILNENLKNMLCEVSFVFKKNNNLNIIFDQIQFILYKIILYKFNLIYDKDIYSFYLYKKMLENISFKKLKIFYDCCLKYKVLIKLSPNSEIGFKFLFLTIYFKINKKAEII